jgi:uncharacterized protein (TIGR00255 family)
MIRSMTGFASRTGLAAGATWLWEARGVNGRGLDLRLRLPDGCDGLEAPLRAALAGAQTRGNVTVSLRLTLAAGGALRLDAMALDAMLGALADVQDCAATRGVVLSPPTGADLLGLRGVMVSDGGSDGVPEAVIKALQADIAPLVAALTTMRAAEGAALQAIVTGQIDRLEALVADIRAALPTREAEVEGALRAALARVTGAVPEVDPGRIAQELAMIAVKGDVTEELDRLTAHIAAARALIAGDPAPGRKLDFLAQEFNREANTLCSKAASADLTALGLGLKALIDQMREQVQNVE